MIASGSFRQSQAFSYFFLMLLHVAFLFILKKSKSIEWTGIAFLLETLSEQVHETVHSFGVNFQTENRCPLAAVSCRIQQILFTLTVLVDNAIEASDGQEKQIELLIEQQGEFIHFGIQNTASLLPMEHSERFFTPFFSTKDIANLLA